jgi:hypothetical protein
MRRSQRPCASLQRPSISAQPRRIFRRETAGSLVRGQVRTEMTLRGRPAPWPPGSFLPCTQWRRALAAPPTPRESCPLPPRPCTLPPSSHHSRHGESSDVSIAASSSSLSYKFLSESSYEEDQSEKEGEETASTSSGDGRGCSSSFTEDAGSTRRCCGDGPCHTQER